MVCDEMEKCDNGRHVISVIVVCLVAMCYSSGSSNVVVVVVVDIFDINSKFPCI